MGISNDLEVGLLAGGHASEHRISLLSSATLKDALVAAGFRVHPVVIGTDGRWHRLPVVGSAPPASPWPTEVVDSCPGALQSGSALEVAATLRSLSVRTIVLGLHGRGGEDGTIQGFLETAGFDYTGSGVGASAVAIDKILCKRVMAASGLPTPPYRVVGRRELAGAAALAQNLGEELGWPLVVKAPELGSSVEVHIAADPDALLHALRSVFRVEERALVERFIRGRELTCPVIAGPDGPEALPIIEIRPKLAAWFDLASKYQDGGADELCPAPIDDGLAERVRRLALALHEAVSARGVSRTDVIVDERGEPFLLEINTLPGMTQASLVPKAARVAGITLPALVRRLVDEARARRTSSATSGEIAAEASA